MDIRGNTLLSNGLLAGPDYLISDDVGNETGLSFEVGLNATRRAYLVYERRNPDRNTTRVVRRKLVY